MKKLLIIAIITINTSLSYAACSIDENATSCSIAEFQQPQPMQRTYSPKSTIKEFAGSPESRLKPSQNDKPTKNLREFGQKPVDYSYNTSCQFGVCNTTGTPQLFEQRGQ